MSVVRLETGRFRLDVDPNIGGSLLGLALRIGGEWLPILRAAPRPLLASHDASCFLLAPYSNRIRDGVFRFEGRTFRLRHPEKHAIHGDVRDRPWKIISCSATELMLEIRSADFADFNFPFALRCEARFVLDDDALTLRLRVVNEGDERMPAGCGLHPYFRRSLRAGENVEIALRATGVYPGATPLPDGPPVPVPAHQDFSTLRPLDVALDHCFAGWDGRARLRWPASGVALRLEASPSCSHVIVYSPAGAPFFALEPVTNANDGFNLFAAGQQGTGVVVLEPGGGLEAALTLRGEEA